nr:class I SAM-dependent methyltransferase [Terrisporobacter petrolearius]
MKGRNKVKLTNRLLKIASLVSENKRLADIGTDHGYIPVYLLNQNKIDFAILADINKGPLENARNEVRRNKLEDKVDLRLGSGIEVLKKGEVEEVIIAGMGGILIGELLEANKEVAHSVEKLILQPMQAQEELRQYLLNNGYEIIDECLEKEDFRLYEIIIAKYTGKNTLVEDNIYYEVGKKLIENKDKLLTEFINNKIKKYNNIINKLGDKDTEAVILKRDLAKDKIEKLKKLI